MVTNKNGVNVLVRTGEIDDAQQVLDIQRETILENDYLISVPEEFDKTIVEQKKWMQELIENERKTIIVAEINNNVVGWIVFQTPTRIRLSHTGSFGMMVNRGYREIGIGKMLVKELLNWAEDNPLIEKVSLGVFSTNQRAIRLYKRFGFEEEGRKIKEIKMNENNYADDVLMYKFVD